MSAVPRTLDALVALFAVSLVGAQVIDGPPTQDVPGDVVAVGLAPQESADVDSTEQPRGLQVVGESFVVLCLARSWSGDSNVKAQRDRTYQLIAGVKAALQSDMTLGGAVNRAVFAGATYTPWISDRGQLVVDVPFRVAVDSLV